MTVPENPEDDVADVALIDLLTANLADVAVDALRAISRRVRHLMGVADDHAAQLEHQAAGLANLMHRLDDLEAALDHLPMARPYVLVDDDDGERLLGWAPACSCGEYLGPVIYGGTPCRTEAYLAASRHADACRGEPSAVVRTSDTPPAGLRPLATYKRIGGLWYEEGPGGELLEVADVPLGMKYDFAGQVVQFPGAGETP